MNKIEMKEIKKLWTRITESFDKKYNLKHVDYLVSLNVFASKSAAEYYLGLENQYVDDYIQRRSLITCNYHEFDA